MSKTIVVEAAASLATLLDDGCDITAACDTLKEAKGRAKYYISADFAKAAELSEPLGYARVLVDEVCVFDVGE